MILTSVYLVYLLAWAGTTLGAPARHAKNFGPNSPPVAATGVMCQLAVFQNSRFCPTQDVSASGASTVQTKLGSAQGVSDGSATRFAVKYAGAGRWQKAVAQKIWQLPNDATDPSKMPLACSQIGLDDSVMSEDCLSMVLYVPDSVKVGTNAPTLVWIHGGSYIVGSASAPGLDGSMLATATESVVAVIQYRLGGFGFMAPNGQTNLAVQDVITSLQFLQSVLPSFGGSSQKITIAGQSSGADMVRALLATDSASHLFQYAILQSDPIDYGFLSTKTQQTLQDYFNGQINCSSSDSRCAAALSTDTIISATMQTMNQSMSLDPSTGAGQPIRPVHDGKLITSTLDSSSSFPKVDKPLLVTTVQNEAASTIYPAFPQPMDQDAYQQTVEGTLGETRAGVVLNSTYYQPGGSSDLRPQLEAMGTDSIWKCAAWTFATEWTKNGGQAYLGMYTVGATYPGNEQVPICTQAGTVCHQDDIEIVFGTAQNPNSAQSALIQQMQARYKAFLHSGNPNTAGVSNWPAASTSNLNAIILGNDGGNVPVGACVSSFWGQSVQYDYQVYNI